MVAVPTPKDNPEKTRPIRHRSCEAAKKSVAPIVDPAPEESEMTRLPLYGPAFE
jgi:hypothetical protein